MPSASNSQYIYSIKTQPPYTVFIHSWNAAKQIAGHRESKWETVSRL